MSEGLPADLSRLTARELEIAWHIAKRENNASDRSRIERECQKRGIRPTYRRKK